MIERAVLGGRHTWAQPPHPFLAANSAIPPPNLAVITQHQAPLKNDCPNRSWVRIPSKQEYFFLFLFLFSFFFLHFFNFRSFSYIIMQCNYSFFEIAKSRVIFTCNFRKNSYPKYFGAVHMGKVEWSLICSLMTSRHVQATKSDKKNRSLLLCCHLQRTECQKVKICSKNRNLV